MNPTGAQTRFSNDRVKAAQLTMTQNPSAQSAMKTHSSASKPGGPPAGSSSALPPGTPGGPPQVPEGFVPSSQPTQAPPKSRPLKNKPQSQSSNKGKQDEITRMLQNMQMSKFMDSPPVGDAYTKVSLSNQFKGRNPGDNVGRQVLDILRHSRK